MTDLTKLTADELAKQMLPVTMTPKQHDAWLEVYRRAQANAQVQAERDEFDEELHTCRAIVGATSEHLHVDLEELVDKLRRTEADSRSWQELATARAQANDALRESLEQFCQDILRNGGKGISRGTVAREIRSLLAAAPAAPPTPAAPVTDLEIEAAITALTVDARREADALRVNPEASGTATEKRANRQVQLRALIARRVASAGAAPATDVHCDLRPGECDEPDEGVCEGERQARDFMAMALTDEAKRKARGWWIPELLSAIDCLRAERLAFLRRAELVESKLAQDTPTPAAPVDPWTPSQCDYDRSIHNNPDANAWADFFVQVHPGLTDKHDVMRGWFANAMMAMHDSPRCKPAPMDSERASADRYESHLFHTDDGMPSSRCRVCGVVYKEAGFVPCKPAPVDSEREAAIEAWRTRNTTCNHVSAPLGGGYIVPDAEIDEAVRLMRSAPPAPAGDQDAKLRRLRTWLCGEGETPWVKLLPLSDPYFQVNPKEFGYARNMHIIVAEIDRLLAAPAASAIAAAPEAPAWREKLDAAAAEIGDEHSYALSIALSDVDYDLRTVRNFVFALREQVESHARRIEALERANNKEAGK